MSWAYTDTAGRTVSFDRCGDFSDDVHIRVQRPNVIICIPAHERPEAAQSMAGDGYRVVPNEGPTRGQVMEVPDVSSVDEILPAIERLQRTANMPDWERELLAGQAAQQEIDQLKRDYDALEKRLHEAEAQAAGKYGPADIARAKADALRAFADTMDGLPDDWILVRRDYGSEVTVEDLLRQTADRYVEQPYPILTQIRVDPKQPDRPEPVDPASVRVGDVVEISRSGRATFASANEVTMLNEDGHHHIMMTPGTTVRVLQAAEPEPDPGQIEALRSAWKQALAALGSTGDEPNGALLYELTRHGVHVEVPTDD